MTRLRAACAAVAFLALSIGAVVGTDGQSAVHIVNLVVNDLTPFEVTFDVQNDTDQAFANVQGEVSLAESTGIPIDQLTVDTFALPAGGRTHVRAASRWEFQLAGTYIVDAALDLGAGALVSASRPFRIVPVELPLASVPSDGSGILTLAQEPSNWGLDRIRVRSAWTLSHGSPDVVVAVIDSGIDDTVPQLEGSLWVNGGEIAGNGVDDDNNGYTDDVNGWDFRDNDASSLTGSPIHGHGTGVASVIAARPGRYPIVGVAPGVKLMDVRFLDSSNAFRSSDWKTFARAVDYAVNNGADIINLSIFANSRPPNSFEQSISNARAHGVIVVGITGNQGQGEVMYPGRYESVVAVSAVSEADLIASFSNHGAGVDISAPGDAVATFTTGGRVVSQSGTSFAAPHVTGVMALLLSAVPTLTAARAIELVEATAVDLGLRGWDDQFGYGLIDAWAALLAALGR
jgi:subtilisin family serine protease